MHFKEIKRKNNLIFTQIFFILNVLHFLWKFWFSLVSFFFFSAWRISFSSLHSVGLLVINLLSFIHGKQTFFCLHSLKIIYCMWNSKLIYFILLYFIFIQHIKDVLPVSSGFRDFWFALLLISCLLFLPGFRNFSLFLIIDSLNMIFLDVVFFIYIPFGIRWACWICKFMYFIKCG